MERYFAEVVSGKVAKVIVAKPEFIATLKGTWIECGGNKCKRHYKLCAC